MFVYIGEPEIIFMYLVDGIDGHLFEVRKNSTWVIHDVIQNLFNTYSTKMYKIRGKRNNLHMGG